MLSANDGKLSIIRDALTPFAGKSLVGYKNKEK
jgi:hypothetical protein